MKKDKKYYLDEYKKFLNEVGMDAEEVLSQVRYERETSLDFVRGKREGFIRDLRLYSNQKKRDDMIGDTTLFNVHDALLSRDFNDKVQVEFEGSISGSDAAQKANLVFREDYESDDYATMKFRRTWDKFFYGVGIVSRTGWDGTTKSNKFRVVNPMTWIPDVYGDYLSGNYRFTGFDKIVEIDKLKKCGYLNTESITSKGAEGGAKQISREQREAQGYVAGETEDEKFETTAEIYMHYAHFNGIKALVRTNSDQTAILSAEIIRPSSPAQGKDPSKIRFPFAFYYWKPKRDDVFGFCVGDFTRDVQISKAKIANYRYEKVRAELYPMYAFNKNYVNSKDLKFEPNKAIPVDTGMDGPVSMDNIISPIRRDLKVDSSMFVDQTMDKQIERSTGVSDLALGTLPENRDSATANSLAQSNLDIKLVLNSKVNKFGERQFVRLWLEGYWENFADGDEKFVSAKVAMGAIPRKFKRDEFLSDFNMDFNVLTQDEVAGNKEKKRLALSQAIPMVQDPSKPSISRDFLNRELLIANGMEPQKVTVAIPRSTEEYRQLIENDLLRRGEFVPVSPEDDDDTHLVVLEEAGDGPEVEAHRMAHIMNKMDKAQSQQGAGPAMGGDLGVSQTVAQNQAMSQQGASASAKSQAMAQMSAQSANSADAMSPGMI